MNRVVTSGRTNSVKQSDITRQTGISLYFVDE